MDIGFKARRRRALMAVTKRARPKAAIVSGHAQRTGSDGEPCDATSSGWSGDYNPSHGGDPACKPTVGRPYRYCGANPFCAWLFGGKDGGAVGREQRAPRVGAEPNPFDDLPVSNCGKGLWPCGSLNDDEDLCCSIETAGKPDSQKQWFAINEAGGVRRLDESEIRRYRSSSESKSASRRTRRRRAALRRYAKEHMAPTGPNWAWFETTEQGEVLIVSDLRAKKMYECSMQRGRVRCDEVPFHYKARRREPKPATGSRQRPQMVGFKARRRANRGTVTTGPSAHKDHNFDSDLVEGFKARARTQ